MAGGFILYDRDAALFQAVMRQYIVKPSIQYAGGDALIFNQGRLEQGSSASAQVDAIFQAMFTPANVPRMSTPNLSSAAGGEEALYIPCRGNKTIWKTFLTGDDVSPVNGTACNANTDTSTVKITFTGSTDDFKGGTIFANGEQRTLTSDTVSGGVHTLVTNKPFTRAITTGDTCIAVPFGRGTRGVKLGATAGTLFQGISPAVADKSGGKVDIEGVSLSNLAGQVPFVLVSFQY